MLLLRDGVGIEASLDNYDNKQRIFHPAGQQCTYPLSLYGSDLRSDGSGCGTGTGGHAIQQAATNRRSGTDKSGAGSVWLDNEKVQVRAQIETISGLSAHADRQELRRWLSPIPQPQRVALHHGEVEAQRSLQGWLGDEVE